MSTDWKTQKRKQDERERKLEAAKLEAARVRREAAEKLLQQVQEGAAESFDLDALGDRLEQKVQLPTSFSWGDGLNPSPNPGDFVVGVCFVEKTGLNGIPRVGSFEALAVHCGLRVELDTGKQLQIVSTWSSVSRTKRYPVRTFVPVVGYPGCWIAVGPRLESTPR